MSGTRKRTKILRAFYRLPARDKAVLLILFASAVGVLVFGLFKLTNSGLVMGFGSFPSSSLIRSGKITERKYVGYSDLTQMVVYPDTNEAVFVGGEPLQPGETGQAFKYNDNILLFVAESAVDTPTRVAISESFLSIISGKNEEGSYKEEVSEKGYLNTLPATYSGGILKNSEGYEYYILTYRYNLENVSLYLGVSVNDPDYLNEASSLLDRAFFTLIEVEENDEPAETVQDEPESTGHSTIETETVDKVLISLRKERGHVQSGMDVMGAGTFLTEEMEVTTADAGKDMAFFFDYTNKDKRPSSAVIENPDGSLQAPVSFNERNSGRIRFNVEKAPAGVYVVKIANDIDFGYCSFSMMDASEYDSVFGK